MTDRGIEKVLGHFKDFQHVFLATADGKQPKVRPVTLIYLDKKFWITTGTQDAKVKQIRENPRVEFCLYFREGDIGVYVRVSGIANIIDDQNAKERIANHIDFFSEHWDSFDDPNYTLLEIVPKEIEYLRGDEVRSYNL
jgi:general stress protein 26